MRFLFILIFFSLFSGCAHQSVEIPPQPLDRQPSSIEASPIKRQVVFKVLSDAQMESQIRNLLSFGGQETDLLGVESHQGIVTLTGSLSSENRKDFVMKAVSHSYGVKGVIDQIQVLSSAEKTTASEALQEREWWKIAKDVFGPLFFLIGGGLLLILILWLEAWIVRKQWRHRTS